MPSQKPTWLAELTRCISNLKFEDATINGSSPNLPDASYKALRSQQSLNTRLMANTSSSHSGISCAIEALKWTLVNDKRKSPLQGLGFDFSDKIANCDGVFKVFKFSKTTQPNHLQATDPSSPSRHRLFSLTAQHLLPHLLKSSSSSLSVYIGQCSSLSPPAFKAVPHPFLRRLELRRSELQLHLCSSTARISFVHSSEMSSNSSSNSGSCSYATCFCGEVAAMRVFRTEKNPVFGEDWRVVASGQSSLHPLSCPIEKHVMLIAKFNSNKPPMDDGSHEPTQFEWVTNINGSLHGHNPEDLLNYVCQTAIWRAESLNTGIVYNNEEMATTPDAQMQMETD
ncbi:hypothetical protein LguiA_015452 [Lonicera macranthoides]